MNGERTKTTNRHRLNLGAMCLWLIGGAAFPIGASAIPVLHLDRLGPLKLGMLRSDAVDTAWISNRRPGCELGGPPLPIVYRLRGPRAPSATVGSVEFTGGRLRTVLVSRGARTALGIRVRRSTVTDMVSRYRAAGYDATAQYIDTFQGTFVYVKRAGRQVLGGFASGGSVITLLGIPFVPVCE